MQRSDTGTPTILIPAAGFGTRVGRPEAKELFLDSESRPLIEWSLNQARLRNWRAHVILRPEKTNLLHYLQTFPIQMQLSWQLILPTQDWPETLYQSEPFWSDKNLVILPDTRFSPVEVIDQMMESLSGNQSCYATFPVECGKTWGCVRETESGYEIGEKAELGRGRAWGIFGFRREIGRQILLAHLESTLKKEWMKIPSTPEFFALETFEDLTRSENQ